MLNEDVGGERVSAEQKEEEARLEDLADQQHSEGYTQASWDAVVSLADVVLGKGYEARESAERFEDLARWARTRAGEWHEKADKNEGGK